jgi:hypothetical protein
MSIVPTPDQAPHPPGQSLLRGWLSIAERRGCAATGPSCRGCRRLRVV